MSNLITEMASLSLQYLEPTINEDRYYDQDLRGGIWLLMTDAQLYGLIEKVYIPVDSTFLTFRQHSRNVVLTETYRVGRGLPLQRHDVGMWTPGEGLEYIPQSLLKRRSDFHGFGITILVDYVSRTSLYNY